MCYYDKVNFACGHFERRLAQYCHFARNDPGHQCFGAWHWKREWNQIETNCNDCMSQQQYARNQGCSSNVHTGYGFLNARWETTRFHCCGGLDTYWREKARKLSNLCRGRDKLSLVKFCSSVNRYALCRRYVVDGYRYCWAETLMLLFISSCIFLSTW